MSHSSKKSLFRIQSESQSESQMPAPLEKLLQDSAPAPFHPKSESNALEWINKAFDLERFSLQNESPQVNSLKNQSQTEQMNTQINRFNNSASIHSKVLNNSSKVFGITTQKLLFNLIRFDFLKNEETEVDFETMITEASSLAQLEGKAREKGESQVSPVQIDPLNSFATPKPPKATPEKRRDDFVHHENTGIPQQTSIKPGVNNHEKYLVNGGIVRLEILERLFVTFEALKDDPPRITGRILLKQKGFAEPQEYQIKWPVVDSTQILLKESEQVSKQGHRFSESSVGLTVAPPASPQELVRQDLYVYKLNPKFLRKPNTPVLVEPKFLDSTHDHLNLRLLLNPKYRKTFVGLDLKILTRFAPRVGPPGLKAKLTQDGFQTKLSLEDFGVDLSWGTKIALSNGNEVEGVWLVAHLNTLLCPQLMPRVDIRVQNELDHFSEADVREVFCDHRMMFEYQRKLLNS